MNCHRVITTLLTVLLPVGLTCSLFVVCANAQSARQTPRPASVGQTDELEARTAQLARDIQEVDPGIGSRESDVRRKRKQLEQLVGEMFERRRDAQQDQIDELSRRLDAIKKSAEQRRRNKQAIVRKQPNFSESNHGFRSFNRMLEFAAEEGLLVVKKDEKGGGYSILDLGPEA